MGTDSGNLIVTRREGEQVVLTLPDGRLAYITVLDVRSGKVRLSVQAPGDVKVDREEVYEAKQRASVALRDDTE